MLGVALDLRRPPLVALGEEADGVAVERLCRRVVPGNAGSDLGRLDDVGDDLVPWRARARAEARERDRRAHAREEVASRHRVARVLERDRELGRATAPRIAIVTRGGLARTAIGHGAHR